ncbi:hypothetical protein H0H93_015700 [Arthromyces matolae]|nr:hypothetical protein H0H93_015700 [Arthromyces matolae]
MMNNPTAQVFFISKPCHRKNFGPRDLRQANLPHVPEFERARSTSPLRTDILTTPPRFGSPLRKYDSSGILVENNTSSPPSLENSIDPEALQSSDVGMDDDTPSTPPLGSPSSLTFPLGGTPSNTGRPGLGGIPRTIPLTPTRSSTNSVQPRHPISNSIGNTTSLPTSGEASVDSTPILQTATGTRYGIALVSNLTGNTGSPKRWAATTNPTCPRCGKSVYFAEQVKAVGKTYHKNCLRCVECKTSLDSNRLRDHDGDPLCVRCYSKASTHCRGGYALLGKAGGA